ncbi:small-conductance mechanosensitive channel [Luminiphilus syltensis NOR5-1B]|uniref:Small-conductance mechanosensitive channel n=1 Tax=Luminiphilus syltensis NOR5-1B TaxID=565045 RepID=B8KQF1_9GAMM|nr:mechanosensitive ion channel domain-containing protein [Luminiphilus syltensis]EED35022.1 small-conductance mechanosensitive channel [Luminiphilus syltensis NOR5-1B]
MPDLNALEQYLPLIIDYGTKLFLALVIFYVGRFVVARLVAVVQRVMLARQMDETLVKFLCSILNWVGLLFVVIAALSQVGINTTSLVALLGAAGLAIGLSLQNSLGNFAAGVMLIIFKPFVKGNFIDAGGAMGTVDSIGIFTTVMTTPDNKEIIIPNGAVIGGNITNFSARPTRRVDMVFGISYGDDLREAKTILEEIIAADERVLSEPAPVITVGSLGDSSVNFLVRPWANAADYWGVLWDTTETVKLRFDEAGITIPFPQMEVHLPQPAETKENA